MTLQVCVAQLLLSLLASRNQGSNLTRNRTTVRPRFKARLFNNHEARGRFFWRLKNYIEVLVSHI